LRASTNTCADSDAFAYRNCTTYCDITANKHTNIAAYDYARAYGDASANLYINSNGNTDTRDTENRTDLVHTIYISTERN
jgi:hypothetical protein